jgi:hypothetical protein
MASPARNRLLATLALGLPVAGCVAPEEPGRIPTMPTARRLLAAEFGAQATAERLDRITAAPRALVDSVRWPTAWSRGRRPLQSELNRAATLPRTLAAGASAELQRRPRRTGWWTGAVLDWEQDLANDLDLTMRLLATSPRPLGEIRDRTHRVDPADDGPEPTFWERLRRRLRL